jgi:uncharacterized repeat protein (TIGR03837 family)
MPPHPTPALRWDVFCRVIDNHGDIGVCWRLSADLAARGHAVRLWVDDASALRWMAPHGAPGVHVAAFDAAAADAVAPADVVVEAFGCDPPATFVARMAGPGRAAPVWVNLEYLSAEAWVERSHRLPSPQPGGLTKWFFFPGFTPATGGLLREPGLLAQRAAFVRPPGPRRALVFCYDTPWLPRLAQAFAGELWLCPGPPQAALAAGPQVRHLAYTDQPGFDHGLWSADLNVVRGEDSLVRALWAGAPFVWHIYPQHDGVHRHKLDALLALLQPDDEVRALWHAWNGFGPWPGRWPDEVRWRAATEALRARLAAQDDLVTQLCAFVSGKLPPSR